MSFKSLKVFKTSKDILGKKLFHLREPHERVWLVQANLSRLMGNKRRVGEKSHELRLKKSFGHRLWKFKYHLRRCSLYIEVATLYQNYIRGVISYELMLSQMNYYLDLFTIIRIHSHAN